MIPDSVEMARGAIGTLHTAYILPEAEWWQEQFDESVPVGRLEETLTSIEYAMQPHPNFLRIVNRYDKSGLSQRRIGEKLLTILLQGEKWYQENTLPATMSEGFDREAAQLYRAAQSMLEHVEASYGQA